MCLFGVVLIVRKEFLLSEQMVSGKFYSKILVAIEGTHLAHTSKQVAKQLTRPHHDNDSSHASLFMHQLLASTNATDSHQPSDSLDLGPVTFSYSPR
jgi:hypothetical protein